jgi:hypothetical protein
MKKIRSGRRTITDITGLVSGRLTVLHRSDATALWDVVCECGQIISIPYSEVKRRRSCGIGECRKRLNDLEATLNMFIYEIKRIKKKKVINFALSRERACPSFS